ncbi:MAG: hypothetical protein JNM99_04810 [Verrucomicrobiaceae bacterium]|nr:hypothetical protein [Verrucomicrobiaceae bacterium]
MNFQPLAANLASSILSTRNADPFVQELTGLMDEIQRTKDWFNSKLEAQLNSLNQLRITMLGEGATFSSSMATLFEAPHPVEAETPEPAADVLEVSEIPPRQAHQAIVLPPTHIAAIDPELEQATLRELNDALSRAFSEIASRGGVPG